MAALRITTIQSDIIWENQKANLRKLDKYLKGLSGQTDLVILPEMFTTGFSMTPNHLAETMKGATLKWMVKKAATMKAAIMGSLIIEESGRYYNRMVFAKPNGKVMTYDKRHLFGLAGEDQSYTAGQKRLIVKYKGWKICPMICYDLRFPVWSRNNCAYDLLIYVANWPEVRRNAWKSLLVARAIENQVYTIGVNRCGVDGTGLVYTGDTTVADYGGGILFQTSGQESVHTVRLERAKMMGFREKLAFLRDQDVFEIVP